MVNKYIVADSFNSIYTTIINEVLRNYEYEIFARGSKAYEIQNLNFELTTPQNNIVYNIARSVNYVFAMKFFAWLINGSDDFSYLYESNKNAINFVDETKTGVPKSFSTAYGPRVKRQLPIIIDELIRDKHSRRAIININLEDDKMLLGETTKTEFPCTTAVTLSIRNDALNMHVNMRSNNVVKTIVYDVYNFTMLQMYLTETLRSHYPDIKVGKYYHTMTSAHVFDDDVQLATDILNTTTLNVAMLK